MKCYINRSNPISLKLLLVSSFAGKSIQVEYVTLKEWRARGGKSLPVIELESGDQIFSSNAVARNILKPSENISAGVDLWLDWESSVLLPALVKLHNEKSSEYVRVVQHADSKLKNKEYLVDNEISVADIVIWSSLYCILSQPNLVSEYLSQNQNIVDWFQKIRRHEVVETVLQEWTSQSSVEMLKALAEPFWYPSVSNIEESGSIRVNDENSVNSISPEELRLAKEAWSSKTIRPTPKIFSAPVLPKKGEKNVLITSALPYVNNVPHLGNIIGCVLSADVFARYCRLRNWNALYIGGTDEFGTATETKAIEEKLTPQQICDKYYVIHKEIYSWFDISFDYFGRTTTPQQKEITQELFLDVHKNNFTSIASVEQLLCQTCDRFLADRFVEGICPNCKFDDARGDQCDGCGHLINAIELINPRCKLCGNTPVVKNSDQIFLELPKIEPVLRDYIEKVSPQWSPNARTIANTWLKDGLKPRCITRDLKWGTPVPLTGFENKVFYVWFDAPIGYCSITACYTDEWRQWWQPSKDTPVLLYQFMAKDNVPFHSVMFPATLLAINKNYQMASHIMATEYLNYEDGKFSKSRGVGVFGTDAKNTGISADIFRFYLLYVRPESQDSSFSWLDFATKNNTELLNNIGNFVNRALVFAEKFFAGVIPAMYPNDEEFTLLALLTQELRTYNSALEKGKLRDGIKFILNVSRHGNQYMQGQKPWVLVKGSSEEKTRAGTVIGMSCNIACLIAVMIQPYMPSTSAIMREQMNAPDSVLVLTNEINILLQPGHKIGKPSPLFTKIEQNTVDSLKNQFAGCGQTTSAKKGDKGSCAKDAKNSPMITISGSKTIEEMEAAILKQGNLIRDMKSKGVEKSEWMPHVSVLKDMKKQYEDLKKAISENLVTNGNS